MVFDIKTYVTRPIVPQATCICLVFLILWRVVVGFMDFRALDKVKPFTSDPIVDTITIEKETLREGLKTAFFGDYVPINLNEANIKQSMLGFTVVGIMFSAHENASHVIIKINERERSFKVGDSLPGGSVIKRITPDGVLILRNGVLESLSLPKKEFMSAPPPQPLIFSE